MRLNKIKRAIISVSNKSNLDLLLPTLKKFKIEIICSGGTFKYIKKRKYKCINLKSFTNFPEILDGRVKTIHPKLYGGILNMRNNSKHKKEKKILNILDIDLVIVDFYPFENFLEKKTNFNKLIENIDIGGPSMVRAAAKNFNDVTVICNSDNYHEFIHHIKKNNGRTSLKFRKELSAKAFGYTAYYDSVISNWLNENLKIQFPEKQTVQGKLIEKLRYGENPHQQASVYKTTKDLDFEQIHGKKLSYNNYNDIHAALIILKSIKEKNATVIVKHANPCGVSSGNKAINTFKNAFNCDPLSAYGGVVAINSKITKNIAGEINKKFFEVIISNAFDKTALKILKKRKNLRLIKLNKINNVNNKQFNFIGNTFLVQDRDKIILDEKKLKIVTRKKPTSAQMRNLKFAYNVCKFVKSNAIVIANDQSTIGIGSGQPSRLDSCKIAAEKAKEYLPKKIIGSVAASDAFFPFSDGIDELINSGIEAIIQPGGSVNDKAMIKFANEANISMIFTGIRHFNH